jgi:hypothetical protein
VKGKTTTPKGVVVLFLLLTNVFQVIKYRQQRKIPIPESSRERGNKMILKNGFSYVGALALATCLMALGGSSPAAAGCRYETHATSFGSPCASRCSSCERPVILAVASCIGWNDGRSKFYFVDTIGRERWAQHEHHVGDRFILKSESHDFRGLWFIND